MQTSGTLLIASDNHKKTIVRPLPPKPKAKPKR